MSMRRDGARPAGGQGSNRTGTPAVVRGYLVLQAQRNRNSVVSAIIYIMTTRYQVSGTGTGYRYCLLKFQVSRII